MDLSWWLRVPDSPVVNVKSGPEFHKNGSVSITWNKIHWALIDDKVSEIFRSQCAISGFFFKI